MNKETYIEKKINCPSCKNDIEFSIKMKNVNITNMKINTKCSSCGAEIIITPSSIMGVVDENHDKNYLENITMEEENISETEIPGEINSFFDDVEEGISKEQQEIEDNKKTREYINDIFS